MEVKKVQTETDKKLMVTAEMFIVGRKLCVRSFEFLKEKALNCVG